MMMQQLIQLVGDLKTSVNELKSGNTIVQRSNLPPQPQQNQRHVQLDLKNPKYAKAITMLRSGK